ncbi:MAG TPA: DUF481 domain-containing protein [Gammaproteobacteria bacterium]|nr:DUF481 domain-containing protein [Gammaproteobacteria bacterium]
MISARLFFVAVMLAVWLPACAADDAPKLDTITGGGAPGKYSQGLSGEVSLGYAATTGNTDTSNLDAKAGIAYGAGAWYHTLAAEVIHATDQGTTTAQSTNAEAQSDYLFTPNNYAFAHLGYNKDEFGGIERRTSETVGYGRRLLNTDTQTWSVQVGAGARQERLATGASRNSPIVQLATDYSWQFSETSSFGQGFVVEDGTDNARFESATSLKVKLVGNFSLALSYTIKRNTNVPPGTANTDTYTIVSLDYSFGS